jgi:predicted transcriptional regulator of viral defense system
MFFYAVFCLIFHSENMEELESELAKVTSRKRELETQIDNERQRLRAEKIARGERLFYIGTRNPGESSTITTGIYLSFEKAASKLHDLVHENPQRLFVLWTREARDVKDQDLDAAE